MKISLDERNDCYINSIVLVFGYRTDTASKYSDPLNLRE